MLDRHLRKWFAKSRCRYMHTAFGVEARSIAIDWKIVFGARTSGDYCSGSGCLGDCYSFSSELTYNRYSWLVLAFAGCDSRQQRRGCCGPLRMAGFRNFTQSGRTSRRTLPSLILKSGAAKGAASFLDHQPKKRSGI